MASMVIFGHSFALSFNQNATEPFSYLFPFTYSGSIAVKVFFFISGILVTNSLIESRSIRKFIIARFLRIYPAFAATIIISSLMIFPFFYHGSTKNYFLYANYISYIANSLYLNTQFFINGVFTGNHDNGSVNGSLWTIVIEVSAYLVVMCLFIFTGFRSRLAVNAICLAIITLPLTNIDGLNFIVDKSSEAYLLPSCFALGSLYAFNKDAIKVTMLTPIAFFIIYKVTYSSVLSQFCFYSSVCTLLLWISTVDIIKSIKIKKDISYGLYLWGFPVQQALCYLFKLSTYQLFFYSLVITVIFAILSFIIVERPSMKASRWLIKNL